MVGLLSVSPGLELERLRQKNILYSAVISLMSYEKECPEKYQVRDAFFQP